MVVNDDGVEIPSSNYRWNLKSAYVCYVATGAKSLN